jgi:hypothetical protein
MAAAVVVTVVVLVVMDFVGPKLLKIFIPTNLLKNLTKSVFEKCLRDVITVYDSVLASLY